MMCSAKIVHLAARSAPVRQRNSYSTQVLRRIVFLHFEIVVERPFKAANGCASGSSLAFVHLFRRSGKTTEQRVPGSLQCCLAQERSEGFSNLGLPFESLSD